MKVRIGKHGITEHPEVSIKALRAFTEVMSLGSATAAARQLGISQPAVSRLISQLEGAFGFELFYREKGRLLPNLDGKRLLSEAELALSSLERLNNLAGDIAGLSSGMIRIVAPPSFSEAILPEIVAKFLRLHPDVEFNIDSRSPDTSRSMIAMRYVDCGFVKLPTDESNLAVEMIMTSGSVCVMAADHRLASAESITPSMIGSLPLILLGAGRRWRSQVDAAFAEHGKRPSVAIETHTHGSACALAARGIGMAILNERLAAPYLHRGLVTKPFLPEIPHKYAFALSSISPPSRLTLAFREVVMRHFGIGEERETPLNRVPLGQ
jgi:DNA-binding transcriptional LysR family regulator